MKAPTVPLSRLLTPIKGEPVRTEAVYPVAGVYSFGRGLLQRDPIRGVDTKYTTMTQLSEGNLVYSKLGAFEGAVALVRAQFAGSHVSPEFPVFEVSDDVHRRYLDHLVSSASFADQLNAVTTGVGARQKRVSPTNFLSLRVPLPDRPEQRRIAAHLDGLAVIDPVAQRATDLARSVLPAARNQLSRSLAKIQRRQIGTVMRPVRTIVQIDDLARYKQVGVRGFGQGVLSYDEVAGSELGKLRYFNLGSSRLLISNIKAWEGAVTTTSADESGRVASNRFLQYEPINASELDVNFVAHCLLSAAGVRRLGDASPGSADRNRTLSAERFEQIEIPVPDYADQRRIVIEYEKFSVIADRARRAAELASAILPAARNEVFSSLGQCASPGLSRVS